MLYWVKFKVDQLMSHDRLRSPLSQRLWPSYGQSKIELKQNLYTILYLEKSFETICGWFGRFYWRSDSKFCWGSNDSTATRRRIHNGWLSGTFWLYWNIIFYKKSLFIFWLDSFSVGFFLAKGMNNFYQWKISVSDQLRLFALSHSPVSGSNLFRAQTMRF